MNGNEIEYDKVRCFEAEALFFLTSSIFFESNPKNFGYYRLEYRNSAMLLNRMTKINKIKSIENRCSETIQTRVLERANK